MTMTHMYWSVCCRIAALGQMGTNKNIFPGVLAHKGRMSSHCRRPSNPAFTRRCSAEPAIGQPRHADSQSWQGRGGSVNAVLQQRCQCCINLYADATQLRASGYLCR